MTSITMISAPESAHNGSLRAGWSHGPAGTGKCRRIGRAELNDRGGSPEVVRSLGQERLGPLTCVTSGTCLGLEIVSARRRTL